jgi:hypothetical protein
VEAVGVTVVCEDLEASLRGHGSLPERALRASRVREVFPAAYRLATWRPSPVQ